MANQADILKAYLVSIGFQVNEADYKKFRDKQEDTDKKIQQIKKTFKEMGEVAAIAVSALGASVVEVASKLEKLYYASQRTGASASNLQAFQFSTEKIGISAEEAAASVEGLANVLRTTPGARAIFQGLGVDTEQDKVKVLLDTVDRLRRMPFYMGSRLGERLGISPNTLFLMEKNFDQLKKFYQENQKLTQGTDEEARASREFANNLKDVENRLTILAQKVAVEFMPVFGKLLTGVEHLVDFLIRADKATHGWSSAVIGLGTAVGGTIGGLTVMRSLMGFLLGTGGAAAGGSAGGGLIAAMGGGATAGVATKLLGGAARLAPAALAGTALGFEAKSFIDAQANRNFARSSLELTRVGSENDRILRGLETKYSDNQQRLMALKFGAKDKVKEAGTGVDQWNPLISKYATQYGIDPLLLREVIQQESQGNPRAKSSKGAMGLMQLMPDTAKGLGTGNPWDPETNIRMGSRMLSNLIKQYGGNTQLALAAYNAGSGNVAKYKGVPPFAETRDYVDRIMSRYLVDIAKYRLGTETPTGPGGQSASINQRTTIHVTGTGDPGKTAEEVYKGQGRVNGDLVRLANGQPT